MAAELIKAKSLVDGHAFSYREQPHTKALFDQVREGKRELVVVVGAGVSMDAGLRSWGALIDKLSGQLDARNKKLVDKLCIDGLERKAHTVLELVTRNKCVILILIWH